MVLADHLYSCLTVDGPWTVSKPHPTENGSEIRRKDSDNLDQRHRTPPCVVISREYERLISWSLQSLPFRPLWHTLRRFFQVAEAARTISTTHSEAFGSAKHEGDRLTRCRVMAIWNFPKICERALRLVVGRRSSRQYSYFLHWSHILLFRYVRNVAREE